MKRSLVYVDNKAFLVDNESGEVLAEAPEDAIPIWVKKRDIRKKPFVIIYQDEAKQLSESNLSGKAWALFFLLLSLSDFENKVFQGGTSLARLFNTSRQHIYKLLLQLKELGLIAHVYPKDMPPYLMISPAVAWKGTVGNQAKAIQQVFSESMKQSQSEFVGNCVCGQIYASDSSYSFEQWLDMHDTCGDYDPELIEAPNKFNANQLGIE